ncbi:DUF1479-domain-containing protein [Hyaloscypha bicolor E]|uniref:DUF1479-domain-containing protein n=1 Tax=Hyaloscypha bicolor E TaxID=1095630 RepID=A0A2J6TF88_9HELO|nr:DUF1479-domain-containing protein [Hyaloscypha bicolor E]PMD61680.1 DUF1479-domain-containing protein [Hyaloscypha bicolor E]
MLSTLRRLAGGVKLPLLQTRTPATVTATATQSKHAPKKEGDISSVFASLSGGEAVPLPTRFAELKSSLIHGHEASLIASWSRLLTTLRSEIELISTAGSSITPSIPFSEIRNHSRALPFSRAIRKRGAAVIKNVVPEEEALGWKEEIKAYIARNPGTKAFPKGNPAVYELYWSPGQVKARAHPSVLETQRFLMSFWNNGNKEALISTEIPVSYADRLRIRQPGDSGFALGPHVDGGSVERWEMEGYGKGGVYDAVFEGRWEDFNPWESSCRLKVESDLYNGAGACSMFRMFQGWLSMSSTGPGEGTLLVNPLFKLATVYYVLRPFFEPRNGNKEASGYLDERNWILSENQSSVLQGATMGCTQELNETLHPHLELEKTMVHIPDVGPGDYVAWHCDSIHAVDKLHAGRGDSSVMYIPACPLTEVNSRYLVRQREAFLNGTPGPDFPGGKGESEHVGRMGRADIEDAGGEDGLRAMGLASWEAQFESERQIVRVANSIVT